MRVLLGATGLFAAVFALHLAIWRIRIPRAGRRLLFLLFLGALPAALLALAAVARAHPALRVAAPRDAGEYLLLAACYLSLSLAYLALYVALEENSPTLSIVRLMDEAEPAGLAPEALRALTRDEGYLLTRLARLTTDGMAVQEKDRYRIAPKGVRMLRYYDFYEKLAGLGHETTA